VAGLDIFVAVLLAVQQAVFGVLAVIMSLKHGRRRYAVIFVALSLVGIVLVFWQAVLAHQSGEESKKAMLGDPERPPYVSIISLPGNTRFVVTNASDFPAYGTKIQLHDETHKTTALRTYDYPEMAAHLAVLDNKPWNPEDDSSEHRFTAEITTRTGLVSEELILRRAGNNQWMRASRIRQGMRTLEQDVDSSWPRDRNGQIDWR
jgi:hypothetical protein